ncbi:hypothetical protein PPIS_a4063 [Pseudoalteromonas piscicida]|uniref:Uncharacterized protein n=1 Tax=Pseudoalteromonas piscicida TaxID=43662 RepID=A0ABN5CN93_PSEO7|nr:hypothetical protein PPIS_a4063 [Pseudoalteromonas piscicida]
MLNRVTLNAIRFSIFKMTINLNLKNNKQAHFLSEPQV